MSGDLVRGERGLSAEVCVVGGGPAGSTVARRLAAWGHTVVLVDRATPGPAMGARERIECLSSSIWRVLDVLGLRQRVAAERFLECDRTRLRWSDQREIARPHPGALIVDRARLDGVLLDAAEAAGVAVLRPARARRPSWSDGRWRVPLVGAASSADLMADFLVDATGRTAGRRAGPPRTAALSASWRGRPPAAIEMRVEAIADGWCWGVALPDGHVHTLVMVDMASCAGLDRRRRDGA